MAENFYELPENLPVPINDGACAHLPGMQVPSICLPSTTGQDICLAKLQQRVVVYCYPLTGKPGHKLPQGWEQIPGARGCTVEACAFRDYYRELQSLHVQVFGLSTQSTADQQELVERLHIPFGLLSDANLSFIHALHLPTFETEDMILIKRLTLVLTPEGQIEKVFYPVFPPDKHPDEVIAWLWANSAVT